MTCPVCHHELTLREYAWTHVHPTREGRIMGIAIMAFGALCIIMAFVRPP